jgi:A/G-specific adenine glycosylase
MQWHFTKNNRQMPWKGEKDPYKVWLSEVILQQTRVEQGLQYFERFTAKYPDIIALAAAKDEEVFKLWEGLGYYNRCKNLLATARLIADKYNGVFPADYETILSLKGVGTYTAAAIASFCFNLAYPVVDGNVLRVLSRVFDIETPVDSTEGKKKLTSVAEKLLDHNNPGAYNQAIMDFGATVCKPALPSCASCPLQLKCGAYKMGKVNVLPVKEKMLKRKTRWFSYFIFECEDKVLVHKRTGKDIWQNLFEFYLIETVTNPEWNENLITELLKSQLGLTLTNGFTICAAARQQLTHQEINGYFIKMWLSIIPASLHQEGYEWVPIADAKKLAYPRFINQQLELEHLQGQLF